MTSVSDIITEAYRESNLIALGVAPRDAQVTEAFKRLSVLVSGALGYEVGQKLHDWPIGTAGVQAVDTLGWNAQLWRDPPINARLVCNVTDGSTVYFPVDPCDGSRMAVVDVGNNLATYPLTLYGNGRDIESVSSIIINTDGYNAQWMYRADLANWVRVTPLDVDGDMPYPEEYDDYFVGKLAMRLNPRYGRSADSQTVDAMQRALAMLQARYRQRVVTPADPGVLALSVQVYDYWRNGWKGRGGPWFPKGWMN